MRQSHPPHSTTSHSHGLRGHLYGQVDCTYRHDEARHYDVLDMPVVAAIGSLSCVKSEAHISISQVFGLRKPRREGVRHDSRLDQSNLHDFPRIGQFYTSLNEANHHAGPTTSNQSQNCCNQTQLVPQHGKKSTNANFGPTHNQHNTNVMRRSSPQMAGIGKPAKQITHSMLPSLQASDSPRLSPLQVSGTPIKGAA